uniref:Velvet domain-containing protein n=1 Tax=Angiostrongylus cantonensis TaxID=6313 RepID=A0A158PCU2_ANGCA
MQRIIRRSDHGRTASEIRMVWSEHRTDGSSRHPAIAQMTTSLLLLLHSLNSQWIFGVVDEKGMPKISVFQDFLRKNGLHCLLRVYRSREQREDPKPQCKRRSASVSYTTAVCKPVFVNISERRKGGKGQGK